MDGYYFAATDAEEQMARLRELRDAKYDNRQHLHGNLGAGFATQSDTKNAETVRVGAIRNQTIAVREMNEQASENYQHLAAIVDAVLGAVPVASNEATAKPQFPNGGEIGDLASSLAQLRDKIRETGSLITRLQSIASL